MLAPALLLSHHAASFAPSPSASARPCVCVRRVLRWRPGEAWLDRRLRLHVDAALRPLPRQIPKLRALLATMLNWQAGEGRRVKHACEAELQQKRLEVQCVDEISPTLRPALEQEIQELQQYMQRIVDELQLLQRQQQHALTTLLQWERALWSPLSLHSAALHSATDLCAAGQLCLTALSAFIQQGGELWTQEYKFFDALRHQATRIGELLGVLQPVLSVAQLQRLPVLHSLLVLGEASVSFGLLKRGAVVDLNPPSEGVPTALQTCVSQDCGFDFRGLLRLLPFGLDPSDASQLNPQEPSTIQTARSFVVKYAKNRHFALHLSPVHAAPLSVLATCAKLTVATAEEWHASSVHNRLQFCVQLVQEWGNHSRKVRRCLSHLTPLSGEQAALVAQCLDLQPDDTGKPHQAAAFTAEGETMQTIDQECEHYANVRPSTNGEAATLASPTAVVHGTDPEQADSTQAVTAMSDDEQAELAPAWGQAPTLAPLSPNPSAAGAPHTQQPTSYSGSSCRSTARCVQVPVATTTATHGWHQQTTAAHVLLDTAQPVLKSERTHSASVELGGETAAWHEPNLSDDGSGRWSNSEGDNDVDSDDDIYNSSEQEYSSGEEDIDDIEGE